MRAVILIVACFVFFSCEKKELPAPKYDRGDVNSRQVEMFTNYKNQVWFRLSDNSVVTTNNKSDWDLGFECSSDGFHIILNSSKAMKAYKTGFQELSQVIDTAGLAVNGLADMPSGNADSTAIGDWQKDNAVYLINRGYNESGQLQGYYKLKINAVSATRFSFEYGEVYGNKVFSGIVNKDQAYNFIMFSFANNQQLIIEPKKIDYDLCFTQYSHVYYNPLLFYQVTGVLSNSYNTRIAKISDKPFAEITISDTLDKVFSMDQNAIGFEWKYFSLENNLYTVNPKLCYLIRDNRGFYYKLHFVDFYNDKGVKGYPKFEFKKL